MGEISHVVDGIVYLERASFGTAKSFISTVAKSLGTNRVTCSPLFSSGGRDD
jgi:hypothetical protein